MSTTHQPSAKLLRKFQTKEEKEAFRLSYSNANTVVERILEVLHRELDAHSKDADSTTRFDDPNWSVHQAYSIGQRKAIRDLINLLNAKER